MLFDVGNTLVFLDLERVAEILGAAGRSVAVPALATAESAARGVMYRHFEANPETTDEERWAVYLAETFRRIGVPPGGEADRLGERLHAAHRSENLWRRVPSGTGAVLEELAARGYRLGVVSNSDGRVPDLLAEVGLARHFEVVIDSRLVGVEKPDPRIFGLALEALGEEAATAVYVGDFPAVDVAGARRAGLRAVLLDPSGGDPPPGALGIRTLEELPGRLPGRAAPPPADA